MEALFSFFKKIFNNVLCGKKRRRSDDEIFYDENLFFCVKKKRFDNVNYKRETIYLRKPYNCFNKNMKLNNSTISSIRRQSHQTDAIRKEGGAKHGKIGFEKIKNIVKDNQHKNYNQNNNITKSKKYLVYNDAIDENKETLKKMNKISLKDNPEANNDEKSSKKSVKNLRN